MTYKTLPNSISFVFNHKIYLAKLLDDGKIVGQGTHEELMKDNKTYRLTGPFEANDEFVYQDGIKTLSNSNGGINGGISNGMPIIIKTCIKPTPSISKEQNTVDLLKNENTIIKVKGRHDPCIVHRARVVVDSMIAIGILDLYVQRFGYEWM